MNSRTALRNAVYQYSIVLYQYDNCFLSYQGRVEVFRWILFQLKTGLAVTGAGCVAENECWLIVDGWTGCQLNQKWLAENYSWLDLSNEGYYYRLPKGLYWSHNWGKLTDLQYWAVQRLIRSRHRIVAFPSRSWPKATDRRHTASMKVLKETKRIFKNFITG